MANKNTAAEMAANVRTELEKQGVTLNQLSGLAGIPESTLYRIVLHDGRALAVDELLRIAEALNVDPATLLPAEFNNNTKAA